MHIFLVILLFAVGIILIVKGGDYFVDAASWMAEVSGIPKLIVGATVVSFATTLPELLVSAFAAAQGKVDMSIGNAVGSVTANLGKKSGSDRIRIFLSIFALRPVEGSGWKLFSIYSERY